MAFLIRSQRGISLVEVLVTLVILSLIGTIVWSVFFQGYRFSQKAVTKNMLQQEANLVVTNLTKIHQTSKQYSISTTDPDCTITVTYTKQDNSQQTQVFSKTGLCYSTDATGDFDPNTNDNFLKITIYDQKDPTNRVEMNAFLYRLK